MYNSIFPFYFKSCMGLCIVCVVILYHLREFGMCINQTTVPCFTLTSIAKSSQGISLVSVYKMPYVPHFLVVMPEVDQYGPCDLPSILLCSA